jgi:hypothetical protein
MQLSKLPKLYIFTQGLFELIRFYKITDYFRLLPEGETFWR